MSGIFSSCRRAASANDKIESAGKRSLFGWEFDTSVPVAEAISEPGNYGFVDRNTTSDGTGIPGGVGGGMGYDGHVIFDVGVSNVEAALQKAVSLGGTRRMGPEKNPEANLVVAPLHGPGRPLDRPE